MARADILGSIYTALRDDSTLVGLLGTVSTANRRIYRAYPQVQPVLTAVEPAAEGWMVLQEMSEMGHVMAEQLITIHEITDVLMHVYATALRVAQNVIDRLDALYHWRVEQQRDVQYGERFLLMSKRFTTAEEYSQETKLYHVTIAYRMTWVKETAEVG